MEMIGRSIRSTLSIFSVLIVLVSISAQSPFNYGQNEKVYFISEAAMDTLGILTLTEVYQNQEGEEGGMGEHWDVTQIDFAALSDEWFPISMDSAFVYNFDTLTKNLHALNGRYYEIYDGILEAYGGNGYGSFDWMNIARTSDTISIIARSCRGHCGDQPVLYSKNVFNIKGELIYTVPIYLKGDAVDFETDDLTAQDFEELIAEPTGTDFESDTTWYHYTENGLLLSEGTEFKITTVTDAKMLFSNGDDLSGAKFHQCYVNGEEMETFIKKALGVTPELIMLEIYRYGVFTCTLNASDKKYYRTRDSVLER